MDSIQHGQPNYDSTLAPFFRRYVNENEEDNNSISIAGIDLKLLETLNNINLSKDIQDFLINNNAIDKELYINNWTFFPINKIIERNIIYEKDSIKNIIDIAFTYMGMGHINVAFYDTKLKKILFRWDGGSNGYDRIDNYNKIKLYDSSKINEELGIEFSKFLEEISKSTSTSTSFETI